MRLKNYMRLRCDQVVGQNQRFTRLTNGFSKKLENHAYSVALIAMYCNFLRMHRALSMMPAVATGAANQFVGDRGYCRHY